MDHIIDSESCMECGHDHLPLPRAIWYVSRQDRCPDPGCDCDSYEEPPEGKGKVYRCSVCQRMVTRVWSSCRGGGYTCDACHGDD